MAAIIQIRPNFRELYGYLGRSVGTKSESSHNAASGTEGPHKLRMAHTQLCRNGRVKARETTAL